MYCAYQTYKERFELDNVRVRFYYGKVYYEPQEGDSITSVSATIYFQSGYGILQNPSEVWLDNKIKVKNIPSFGTRKYEYHDQYGFAFSEFLTIPRELFAMEKGIINYSISTTLHLDDGTSDDGDGYGTYLFYKVVGKTLFYPIPVLNNKSIKIDKIIKSLRRIKAYVRILSHKLYFIII